MANNAILPNVEPSIAAGIPLTGKKAAKSAQEFLQQLSQTNWRKEGIKK